MHQCVQQYSNSTNDANSYHVREEETDTDHMLLLTIIRTHTSFPASSAACPADWSPPVSQSLHPPLSSPCLSAWAEAQHAYGRSPSTPSRSSTSNIGVSSHSHKSWLASTSSSRALQTR